MNRLSVEVVGRGPDVVLVHGWGLHGGYWTPLVERLSESCRFHIVDLPGHGHSRDAAPPGTTLESWARWLLDSVPVVACWIGWSLGGMLALAAARLAPAAVTKLALIATTPKFVNGSDWPHAMAPATFHRFADDLESDYRATLLRFLSLQVGAGAEGRETLRTLRAQLTARGEPAPAALRAGLDLLQTGDLRDSLARIATPALVLHGHRDRLALPAAAQALASGLPNARLVMLENAGHAPMVSHPATLAAHLAPWLGSSAA
jgi:pimeloyl-[acyl-carrier protein] methyl ester esterase